MSQKSKVNITKITAKSRPQATAAADPTKPKTQTQPKTQTKPTQTQPKTQTKPTKTQTKVTKAQAKQQAKLAKTKAKAAKAKIKAKANAPEKPLKQVFILARPFVALGRYLRNSWRELRQVRWPNRKATWKMTLAVLVYCAIFIVFIMLLDALFTFIFDLLLKTNA